MLFVTLPAELEGTAEKLREWAATKREVRNVRLFGSRIYGRHRPDSDLDIAVALDGEPGEALASYMFGLKGWTHELERTLGLKVDLQLAHRSASPCVWSYLRQGCVMVYRRQRRRS